jgi:hypothetical protein
MCARKAADVLAVAVTLLLLPIAALAFDESKYPDMQGQWARPSGIGADGLIWPVKKGQARPDLRHFE